MLTSVSNTRNFYYSQIVHLKYLSLQYPRWLTLTMRFISKPDLSEFLPGRNFGSRHANLYKAERRIGLRIAFSDQQRNARERRARPYAVVISSYALSFTHFVHTLATLAICHALCLFAHLSFSPRSFLRCLFILLLIISSCSFILYSRSHYYYSFVLWFILFLVWLIRSFVFSIRSRMCFFIRVFVHLFAFLLMDLDGWITMIFLKW